MKLVSWHQFDCPIWVFFFSHFDSVSNQLMARGLLIYWNFFAIHYKTYLKYYEPFIFFHCVRYNLWLSIEYLQIQTTCNHIVVPDAVEIPFVFFFTSFIFWNFIEFTAPHNRNLWIAGNLIERFIWNLDNNNETSLQLNNDGVNFEQFRNCYDGTVSFYWIIN